MRQNPFPACICCNPFFQEVLLGLTRRKFMLGTASLTAAVLMGNGSKIPVQAQTEGIRILTDDTEAIEEVAPAATVYVAKTILTMETEQPTATAVAVVGDRILAVGSLDRVIAELGQQPYTIDRTFADKVIVPGLIEQHLHPLLGALTMAVEVIAIEDWNVPGKSSKAALNQEDYISRLKEALVKIKGSDTSETLFTWGYHHYFHGQIYRQKLDEISPDHPIVVWHRSCHEFILNSAALAKYGATEAALQGHGQASEQSSWADGHFYEKGMELIIPLIAEDIAAPERLQAGVGILKAFLHTKGVTTICEPGTQLNRQIHEFWETSLNADDAIFRTYFIPDGRTLYEKYKNNLSELLPATQAFLNWGRDKVQWLPNQVKLFADGAIFSQLMQVQQPYLDGHKGEWIAIPEDYQKAFQLYWDAGYQIHTHVNGDAGLEVVVNVLAEQIKVNPRNDHRFTVVHFAVSTDDQVSRLSLLGAIVSANPYYVTSLADLYSEIGLGAERSDTMVRLKSAIDNGISISLHSDMPMAPADPLFLAWCAVTRTTVSGRTAAPEQRITVEKALRAVTIEAAYSLRLENEIGSIKPDKKADFTILEQDPFAVAAEKLKDIPVWGIVFAGQVSPVPTMVTNRKTSPVHAIKAQALELESVAKTRG